MEKTYKGVTTYISDNLLEANVVVKKEPQKNYKFKKLSLYYDGVYYFPDYIKKSEPNFLNRPFEVQVVYFQGKWFQDTMYISETFKDFLLKYV
jgi:hypothetical protein